MLIAADPGFGDNEGVGRRRQYVLPHKIRKGAYLASLLGSATAVIQTILQRNFYECILLTKIIDLGEQALKGLDVCSS